MDDSDPFDDEYSMSGLLLSDSFIGVPADNPVEDLIPTWQVGDSPDSGYRDTDVDSIRLIHTEILTVPELKIESQPENSHRFRYRKETKKPHGPIKGLNPLPCQKRKGPKMTGPRVKLNNFEGKARIRCWLSLASTNEPHVHQLVSDREMNEPHEVDVGPDNDYTASFNKLYIINTVMGQEEDIEKYYKKKCEMEPNYKASFNADDIRKTLKKMDPIEKSRASLYFEAFALDDMGNLSWKLCDTKSTVITNKKNPTTSDLKIVRIGPSHGSCKGGDEVFIFVEKIVKEVKIKFFDDLGWSDYANFESTDIHKQVAIAFRTPPYCNLDIDEDVKVQFQLERLHDGVCSEPHDFSYKPLSEWEKRKKARTTFKARTFKLYVPASCFSHPKIALDCVESSDNLRGPIVAQMAPEEIYEPISFGRRFGPSKSIQVGSEPKGITANISIETHGRALHEAIETEDVKLWDEHFHFIQQHPEVLKTRNGGNETITHAAVSADLDIFIKGIVPYCDLSVLDADSNNACHLATIHSAKRINFILSTSNSTLTDALCHFNYDGETPFITAVTFNSKSRLDAFFKNLTDSLNAEDPYRKHYYIFNAKNKKTGNTALHESVKRGYVDLTKYLLESKAVDIEAVNSGGYTPLHFAVMKSDKQLVQLLLSHLTTRLPENEESDESLFELTEDLQIQEMLSKFSEKNESPSLETDSSSLESSRTTSNTVDKELMEKLIENMRKLMK